MALSRYLYLKNTLVLIFLLTACAGIAYSPSVCYAVEPTAAFLDASAHVDVQLPEPVQPARELGKIRMFVDGREVKILQVEQAKSEGATKEPLRANPNEVVLAGSFQAALGGKAWQPNGQSTRMHETSPGVWQLVVRLPAGSYEYKVVRGGSWDQNWGADFKPGGANMALIVASRKLVRFVVDFNRQTILNSIDNLSLVTNPAAADLSSLITTQTAATESTQFLQLDLSRPLGPTDIVRPMYLQFSDGQKAPVYARGVLSEPSYVYHGDDLGPKYRRTQTIFKVWCPVAESASLLMFSGPTGGQPQTCAMTKSDHGVWTARLPGDLNGKYYQYKFLSYGTSHVAPDIYAPAADASLQRSMVFDLAKTDPADWNKVSSPRLASPTDAIVYELHIRDFTSDPSSGLPESLRGTYQGLVYPGSHVADPSNDHVTGLDYLKSLGVNYVHVLPIQSINATHHGYNWGYETQLFNVPESRYALHRDNPAAVIGDVKTMVLGLHRAHIGLVMDVVYNHSLPVSGEDSPFWATVPYYWFRTSFDGALLNESGVGNALDDDSPMVRKFIRDSLVYWQREYHIDGFRFDLMGMFTPATITSISQALHQERPDILLYGEPWTGGGPTRFGKGSQKNLGVAVFNDNFRNALRGDLDGPAPGFALGGRGNVSTLRTIISGSPDFTASPTETMNYISVHDNLTLLDKIQKSWPNADLQTQQQMLKFAGSIVLLSQGVPILEGGAEMGRTKGGDNNSLGGGDPINHFDWQRGIDFLPVSDYYKALIALRRAHPAFRCNDAKTVQQTLSFINETTLPSKTEAFELNGAPTADRWPKTLVIFHGNNAASQFTLPPGKWRIAIDDNRCGVDGPIIQTRQISLAPLTTYVYYRTSND